MKHCQWLCQVVNIKIGSKTYPSLGNRASDRPGSLNFAELTHIVENPLFKLESRIELTAKR